MLDSERNSHETDSNEANGRGQGAAEAASTQQAPAVPAALFQAPQVLFQPPAAAAVPGGEPGAGVRLTGRRRQRPERRPRRQGR